MPRQLTSLTHEIESAPLRNARFMMPKSPIVDWSTMGLTARKGGSSPASTVDAFHNGLMTSSGRAAIYQALSGLAANPGRRVLVPTYHCPSMVAPIVRAGLQPTFYGLDADGQPRLAEIEVGTSNPPVAMLVSHFFGLPLALDATRAWCDVHGIVLIEDCAHCFFGQAGGLTVGHWGNYSIASLTKFFPLPEAGLLFSNHGALEPRTLRRPTWRAELQGFVDQLEIASRYGHPRGFSTLLRGAFAAKNWIRRAANASGDTADMVANGTTVNDAAIDCDMERVDEEPLWISRWLFRKSDRARIYLRRRENYLAYGDAVRRIAGSRALHPSLPEGAAPYVFPLLVDDADRVYRELRHQGMPVFRWDRTWPQTPALPHDCAPLWRQQLLQLLCHQSLSVSDVGVVCDALSDLLTGTRPSHRLSTLAENPQ